MENCLTGILSETDNEFDRYWDNMEFCAKITEQQREMEKFVNESLILASGNVKAIQEMTIIQESAFTDKIKGFFTKIKNFFKKIFSKLGAAMNGLFMEQKKYIDKYANIITKLKYKATDVEDVKDHFKGIPRIIDVVDNTETAVLGPNKEKYLGDTIMDEQNNAINITQAFPYNDANKILAIKELPKKFDLDIIRKQSFKDFTNNGYWANMADFKSNIKYENDVPNVEASFRSYFDGSPETVSWSIDDVEKNFQTVINITYAGPSYLKKLEKIISEVEKKMDEVEKKMDEYYKVQSAKIQEGIKNFTPGNKNADNTDLNKAQKATDVWTNATITKDKDRNYVKVIDGVTYKAYDSNGSGDGEKDKFLNAQTTKQKYTESYDYLEEIGPSGDNKNKETTKISSDTGKKDVNNASQQVSNVSNMQTKNAPEVKDSNTANVDDSNKDKVLKIANDLLDIDIYNRQNKINADVQISSAIARSIFASFKLTNSDFWWIIQRHVQWYLSNPDAEKDSDNKSSLSKSLNLNAGNEQVKTTTTNTPTHTP